LNRSIFKQLIVAVMLFAVVGVGAVSTSQAQSDQLNVVTSFFVTFVFADAIGGDLIDLDVVVGPGFEAHEFEPTIQDVEKIQNADVFIYNGAGFENPWVDPLLDNGTIGGGNQVVIETSELVFENGDLIALNPDEDEEGFGTNPHIWLDPILAIEITRTIEEGLAAADPANAATYRANGAALRGELGVLDTEIQSALQSCAQNIIVQSHQFMDYFALRYGFQVADTGAVEPEEPSVADIEALIQVVQENNINFIFSETFVTAEETGLQQVADATGAEILLFEVFEGFEEDEIIIEEEYIEVMRENLEQLEIGLECN